MSLRTMLFGTGAQTKARVTETEQQYDKIDARLKTLADQRTEMREKLAVAMRQIIEERATK